MKRVVTLVLATVFSVPAFAGDGEMVSSESRFTPKEKMLMSMGAGLVLGLGTGGYFANQPAGQESPGLQYTAYGLIGTVTGALFSYFFQSDTDEMVLRERDHWKAEALKMSNAMAQQKNGVLPPGRGQSVSPDTYFSRSQVAPDIKLTKEQLAMNPQFKSNCVYSLIDLNPDKATRFIPVGPFVMLRRLEYVIAAPIDPATSSCVNDHEPKLELELPGLHDVLFEKGLQRAQEERNRK